MSLTKEMMYHVENEVSRFDDESLIVYYNTHKKLNDKYPNSYYQFMLRAAFNEMLNRGIEDERSE